MYEDEKNKLNTMEKKFTNMNKKFKDFNEYITELENQN